MGFYVHGNASLAASDPLALRTSFFKTPPQNPGRTASLAAFYHFGPGYPAVDVRIDGVPVATAVPYGSGAAYVPISFGAHELTIVDAETKAVLYTTDVNWSQRNVASFVLTGSPT